jgi:TonB family protein
LAAEPFDVKLLDLPRQAIARRECDGETPPKEVSTPEVDWPRGAPPGNVSAALTVLEDGSVGDVRLIGSSTQQMNDTVIKALKAWKFKPAMCGADPVVADIEVAVSMRRY